MTVPVFYELRILFSARFVTPFCALSLCFRTKLIKSDFVTLRCSVTSLPATSYDSNHFEVNVLRLKFMPFLHKETNTSNTNFWYPKFPPPSRPHGALFQSQLPFPWLSLFVSFWQLIDFFLVSFCRGSSWTTTMGLTGDVCVSFFKTLYPSFETVCVRTYVFAYNSNSRVSTWYCYIFFTRKSLNTLCRNEMSSVVSFFSEIQYKHVKLAGNVIFILVRADKTELLFIYSALQHCLAFVGNSTMLISVGASFVVGKLSKFSQTSYILC
jgi:hypothetical protein